MIDTETLLTILGGIGVCIGGGTVGYINLTQRITAIETKQDIRDKFFQELERKAMQLLHRDDDEFGLDSLVEEYKRSHNELSYEKWQILRKKCDDICSNESLPTEERILAALGSALATHKLMLASINK